jgi:pyruvate/2-oxoglutarate dehydrogenase complex dihydrolipoamide acyltransferase (E2) component
MAATVTLPKFGLTMEEATVNEWLVGIGEHVEQGQTLAVIDSEKVSLELPSPVAGIVAEYLVQIGETVPVGSPLALIVEAEEFEQYVTPEA